MFDYYEPVITPSELADCLNCGMNSAYKLLREGKIHSFKIGKSWRIPKRAVQEYICQQSKLKAAGYF